MEARPKRAEEREVSGIAQRLPARERSRAEIESDDGKQPRQDDDRGAGDLTALDPGHGR
jgi:hypothetical protein